MKIGEGEMNMSPFERYRDWFERLPSTFKEDFAFVLATMLPGWEVPKLGAGSLLPIFITKLEGIAKRNEMQNAGLTLTLVALTDHYFAEQSLKDWNEAANINDSIRRHAIESGDSEMAQQGQGHRERLEFMLAQQRHVESGWTEAKKSISNLPISEWLTMTLDRNIGRDLDM